MKQAVAFLFRRSGEAELAEDEFIRQASLDLHWFSPKDARRFLESARALGYLSAGGAPRSVRPSFGVEGVEVPLDFRATPQMLEGAPEAGPGAVSEALAAAAASASGLPLDEIWERIRKKQASKLLEPGAAALLVAAEASVTVHPYIARVIEEANRAARAAGASPSAS
jgi:hypothetical protein